MARGVIEGGLDVPIYSAMIGMAYGERFGVRFEANSKNIGDVWGARGVCMSDSKLSYYS